MTKLEIVQRLLDPGIIAIIRADSSEQLVEAAGALLAGGVTAMEVTMTTPNALEVITAVTRQFGDAILMGVGTVIDPETARAAVAAGAEFIVTPVTKPEVIAVANELGKPIASGALTPTECLLAHESGADFVKLFPADVGGPSYIKNLLAPLPMLRIVPTGGVTPETAGAFLQAGCVALGVGSSLVSKKISCKSGIGRIDQSSRRFCRSGARGIVGVSGNLGEAGLRQARAKSSRAGGISGVVVSGVKVLDRYQTGGFPNAPLSQVIFRYIIRCFRTKVSVFLRSLAATSGIFRLDWPVRDSGDLPNYIPPLLNES